MKNKLLILLVLCGFLKSFAQQKITWKDLAEVEFVDKFYPDYDQYYLYPEFSSAVKSLEGKKVTLTGYFLDLDPDGKIFVLSKGPMSSCFFCGVGGPETAVELHFSEKPSFKMDTVISVTGVLELNGEDVEHFNYILKKCEATLATQ